jgi:ABC-2 type transport system permease protein
MATHFFADTAALTGRTLRHVTRSLDTVLTTAILPIVMMLMFVYVFGGAIDTGPAVRYVDYLLPGILLITIGSGVSYTAFRLFMDLKSGIFERFQSMPIARSGVLWAHVLTSLRVLGMLVLFILALTWIAVIVGLSASSVDGVGVFSYPLIFLPFVSSAFVPTQTMPGPLRWFAENQPVTSIVNTIRSLFAEQPAGSDSWTALAWCAGIVVIAYGGAMVAYRRKIA